MRRSHRVLPAALLVVAAAFVAACDIPTAPAPAPLSLNRKTAADLGDTLLCANRGYTIIQGVVTCNPGPT